MRRLSPLCIGRPFILNEIDFALLKNINIEPILAYPKGISPINKNKSVFYKDLNISEISKIVEDHKIDAIICFNDNFLIETAQIRTKYNIPGLHFPEIEKYKIKSKMYRALGNEIIYPPTIHYIDNLKFENIVENIGKGEYFIKPNNLAGSEGGCHIQSQDNYTEWKKNDYNLSLNYVIQKFYTGTLFHCELIVRNGVIKYIQARRYSYPNHMFLKGKIIASFPIIDLVLKNKIEQAAIKVQKVLKYNNGVMHTEFFLDNNSIPVFLETNIRQAGAAINLIHKRRAGISLETAMVLLELDKDINIVLDKTLDYDLCGYIPRKKGIVTKISLPQLKGQYNFDIKVKVGENCDYPKSGSDAEVAFVGSSVNYQDLIDDFDHLENHRLAEYKDTGNPT
jgi:biotin carboxylase